MNLSNSLQFLSELAANNTKEWMDEHKKWYQQCRSEFIAFVDEVIAKMQDFEPGVAGLEGRKCIFRINRDIRFSNDKSPYKINFGAAISEGGKHSEYPSYYFHLQPGENFIGGGIYMPQADVLKKIRQEIDYNPETLKQVLANDDFRDMYGDIHGEKLKTAPKGYPKDHPNLELLKLKSFVVIDQVGDDQVKSDSLVETVIEHFRIMKPFNDYLVEAVA